MSWNNIIPVAVVLPSEAAQQLAQHLKNNENNFIELPPVGIDVNELAHLIQEYWDSLI